MRLRDILDYYGKELEFNQVMELYINNKIGLKNGLTAPSDLRVICKECDLDPVDNRNLALPKVDTKIEKCSEHLLEDMSPEDLSKKARILDKEQYHLKKKLRKLTKNLDGSTKKIPKNLREIINQNFENSIDLADTYEESFSHDPNEEAYLRKAIENRVYAVDINSTFYPTTASDQRNAGNNLLKLAELEIKVGKSELSQVHLKEAKGYFEKILGNIRNSQSKLRAEENAKIGIIHWMLYQITNLESHLKEAEKIFSAYESIDTNCKYLEVHLEILEHKEAYTHE